MSLIDKYFGPVLDDGNPFIEHPASHTHRNGGDQYIFMFPNNHGASVVRHEFSYGATLGLWELAILDGSYEIDYTSPISDDVIGWLTNDGVRETLRKIAEL